MSRSRSASAVTLLGVAAWLCGCAEAMNGAARDVRLDKPRDGQVLSQAELQQDIQRFTGQFMDRVTEAAEPLAQADDPRLRELGMRRLLLYQSASLEIASGPLPEVNVLDMLVFLALSRGTLERFWNPRVFGTQGHALLVAFVESERDMTPIAGKLMSPQQREHLRELVRAWQAANPDQHRVEGVRFYEFAAIAGQQSAAQAERARGLLSQVKTAIREADQALLLGDRAMFLVHRLPFVFRLQARLGVSETLSDTSDRLGQVEALLERMPEAQPLISQLAGLTSNATEAAREANKLLDQSQPLLATIQEGKQGAGRPVLLDMLETGERLTDKTVGLLHDVQGLVPADRGKALAAAEQRVDRIMRRWIGYLVLLGAAWALFFWSGYFAVKRLTAPERAPAAADRSSSSEPTRPP